MSGDLRELDLSGGGLLVDGGPGEELRVAPQCRAENNLGYLETRVSKTHYDSGTERYVNGEPHTRLSTADRISSCLRSWTCWRAEIAGGSQVADRN